MDYHVKVLISFAVVMTAFSPSFSMERPRLLPQPESKSLDPRAEVINAISDAVYGPSNARAFTLADLPPEAECASPTSLYKMSRKRLEKIWLQNIEKQGISLQDLEKHYPALDIFFKERIEKRKLATIPAGSPLKRIMSSVSNAMNLPDLELRVDDENSIARCVGNALVVCNPSELNDEAPTPRKIRHVLGHERCHAKNEDTKLRLAYRRALKSAGKNPDDYKETAYFGQRIGEVFSDLETASLGQDWANSYAEITARSAQRKKEYKPTSHPTLAARRNLGEWNKRFYFMWMQEQKKLQDAQVQADTDNGEVIQPRKVARRLFEEKQERLNS